MTKGYQRWSILFASIYTLLLCAKWAFEGTGRIAFLFPSILLEPHILFTFLGPSIAVGESYRMGIFALVAFLTGYGFSRWALYLSKGDRKRDIHFYFATFLLVIVVQSTNILNELLEPSDILRLVTQLLTMAFGAFLYIFTLPLFLHAKKLARGQKPLSPVA